MSLKTSSIIRKVSMALSGLFLVVFLTQHFTINLTSVFSKNIFNEISHFMGNNFIVQFILQPILIFGVVFHFVMGFVLEYINRNSRDTNYVSFKGSSNSNWLSRNMIYCIIQLEPLLYLKLEQWNNGGKWVKLKILDVMGLIYQLGS